MQPYPHQRKKGLMIAVSLTFLFCLIEVLRGKGGNLYRLMLPLKVLTEQNCLQDHTAEKHREGRAGERLHSPLLVIPLFLANSLPQPLVFSAWTVAVLEDH